MDTLSSIVELAIGRESPDDDNVRFPPLTHEEIEKIVRQTEKTPNVSAVAAISSICDNPHATSTNFKLYTDDSRFGPFIEEYDDTVCSSGLTQPDYRGYALDPEDPDDATLDDVSHQLASVESDMNELKSTIENMVQDVSDIVAGSHDTAITIKGIEDIVDRLVSEVCDLKLQCKRDRAATLKWQNSVDEKLAKLLEK